MSMMKRTLHIEGIGIDTLLSRLQQEGFTLRQIRQVSRNAIEADCDYDCFDTVQSLIAERGFSAHELPPHGITQHFFFIKQRCTLFFAALLLLSLIIFSLQFIWHIEITGAGVYLGEVRSYLREASIAPGTRRSEMDLDIVCKELTWRLPQVAWVRARHQGLTLRIEITQGTPSPVIENQGGNGHLIAAQDGVIQSIAVYAGTAAVKVGDTVRAGDVLIYGHERAGNETLVPVRARGSVIARTFVTASAAASADGFTVERTGNSAQHYAIASPIGCLSLTEKPAYLTSEIENERIVLGGAWLPVWLEQQTVYEIALSPAAHDEAALKAEAGRLAMQKLLFTCGGKDEIIDKWLDYSMIEGGNILATVTAEVRTDIASFSPATPDEEI